jgi:hypothetical protein
MRGLRRLQPWVQRIRPAFRPLTIMFSSTVSSAMHEGQRTSPFAAGDGDTSMADVFVSERRWRAFLCTNRPPTDYFRKLKSFARKSCEYYVYCLKVLSN